VGAGGGRGEEGGERREEWGEMGYKTAKLPTNAPYLCSWIPADRNVNLITET